MNKIQAAYADGHNAIALAFLFHRKLDIAKLGSWIDVCLAQDLTVEKIQLNNDNDPTKSTMFEMRKAEACAFRLMGAFHAVETIRAELDAKKVFLQVRAAK